MNYEMRGTSLCYAVKERTSRAYYVYHNLTALQIVACMVLSIFSTIVAIPAFFVWAVSAAAMREVYVHNKYVSRGLHTLIMY